MRCRQNLLTVFFAAPLFLCCLTPYAQTLARPGFTAATESWWRNAVFYRIAPEHFQDSDGDGIGDLRGIAQRLDYLQSLGVDAIILQLPFDDTGFDDLLAEASRRHIRIAVGLNRPPVGGATEILTATASHWLARGAAGILLPASSQAAKVSMYGQPRPDMESTLLQDLRRAAARLPGERVIIPEAPDVSPASEAPASGRAPAGRAAKAGSPQLVLTTLPITAAQASSAAEVLVALAEPAPNGSVPLLQLPRGDESASEDKDAAVAAATLLSQHAAILLEYGQELGETAPNRMPWTPSNVTPAPEPPPQPAKPVAPTPTASGEIVYGPYRPYVPPPPAKPKPPVPPPGAIVLPDPDSLPGFTTKPDAARPTDKPGAPAAQSALSVVLQERDPHSVLNLYRRLLALHHGNPAFRSGSLVLLHGNAGAISDNTVAWLRQPPTGARTGTPAIIAVNCSDAPAELSLEEDLARLHVGKGELRSLFTGGQIMGRTRLTLTPHAVFIGELVQQR